MKPLTDTCTVTLKSLPLLVGCDQYATQLPHKTCGAPKELMNESVRMNQRCVFQVSGMNAIREYKKKDDRMTVIQTSAREAY